MKITRNLVLLFVFFCSVFAFDVNAQSRKAVSEMTKEEMMQLTYDDLLSLPFEDLILLANKFGFTAEQLLEMFLNKDVTIASKKEESSFESPLSTTVISREEIENSGAISIPELLRLSPGLIVREKTPGNYDVHIRGNDNIPPGNMSIYSENTLTLIMIDGRIVYNYGNGGTFWETLPIDVDDIERVEIVRGPSSAMYGPNAVSGVINFITKPADSKEFQFNIKRYGGIVNTAKTNEINSSGVNASMKFGIGDKLKFRISENFQHLKRSENDIYFWPLNGYFPMDSIRAKNPWNRNNPISGTKDAVTLFPNPENAVRKYGINANATFTGSKDFTSVFTCGYQNSQVLTNILDNSYYAIATRDSKTKYADLKVNAYGLSAQFSYTNGTQNYAVGGDFLKFDIANFHGNLEYLFSPIKNFNLRLGLNYQNATYDDAPYISVENKTGLFNGKRELNSLAPNARLDFSLWDVVRFVAAVRNDKYNTSSDNHTTYQFATTIKINKNNLIRGVISRAERSPFMVDNYSDYNWQKVPVPAATDPSSYVIPKGVVFRFEGNDDLKLAKMDMSELGYRVKIGKYIQADLELFYSRTTNFDAFMPDSISLARNPLNPSAPYFDATGNPVPKYILFKYYNYDFSAEQYGASLNVNIALSEKTKFTVFGTLQKTELEDYYPLINEEIVSKMIVGMLMKGKLDGGVRPDTLVFAKHKNTPKFYGGFALNYKPNEKWNINTSLYYYSKQTYQHQNGTMDIKAKAIFNLMVSYKFYKECSIYFNARNLTNNNNQEFGFLDKIGGKYFVGLNFNF